MPLLHLALCDFGVHYAGFLDASPYLRRINGIRRKHEPASAQEGISGNSNRLRGMRWRFAVACSVFGGSSNGQIDRAQMSERSKRIPSRVSSCGGKMVGLRVSRSCQHGKSLRLSPFGSSAFFKEECVEPTNNRAERRLGWTIHTLFTGTDTLHLLTVRTPECNSSSFALFLGHNRC